jgi:hypothetical protein
LICTIFPVQKKEATMANETGPGANLPENPLLARLLAAVGATTTITLRGYVGPSRAGGYVIVYPRLDDLSDSIEVARADILYFTEVPELVMPFGAVMIWVKMDAQIVYRRGETAKGTDLAEVRKGRLRILTPLRRRLNDVEDCHSYPNPPGCKTCQSHCYQCMSVPK